MVVGVGAAFVTGREAHLHFGINAAGESGVRVQIVNAAAHFEKIECVTGELFGGSARRKRTVVKIGETGVSPVWAGGDARRSTEAWAIQPAEARGHRRSRIFVF